MCIIRVWLFCRYVHSSSTCGFRIYAVWSLSVPTVLRLPLQQACLWRTRQNSQSNVSNATLNRSYLASSMTVTGWSYLSNFPSTFTTWLPLFICWFHSRSQLITMFLWFWFFKSNIRLRWIWERIAYKVLTVYNLILVDWGVKATVNSPQFCVGSAIWMFQYRIRWTRMSLEVCAKAAQNLEREFHASDGPNPLQN